MKKFTLEIENYNGNTMMAFEIGIGDDGELKILQVENCSLAGRDGDYIFDTGNDLFRIQSDVNYFD